MQGRGWEQRAPESIGAAFGRAAGWGVVLTLAHWLSTLLVEAVTLDVAGGLGLSLLFLPLLLVVAVVGGAVTGVSVLAPARIVTARAADPTLPRAATTVLVALGAGWLAYVGQQPVEGVNTVNAVDPMAAAVAAAVLCGLVAWAAVRPSAVRPDRQAAASGA